MEHSVLVIHNVANYNQAEKDKKMQYATWSKKIERDPYWVVPHAFKTQDLELYDAYRMRLSTGAP